MDIAGAEALVWRLAQQQHWQSARAVKLGLQPSIDPDGGALESFHGELRIYRVDLGPGSAAGAGSPRSFARKRLVEGAWEEEPLGSSVPHTSGSL